MTGRDGVGVRCVDRGIGVVERRGISGGTEGGLERTSGGNVDSRLVTVTPFAANSSLILSTSNRTPLFFPSIDFEASFENVDEASFSPVGASKMTSGFAP